MTVALLIEDDRTLIDVLEERLLSMGHECRKARSQAEAVELLDGHTFDYILLDLQIPSRPDGRADIVYGLNLLRKIRQMPGYRRTPILVMTGHGLESHHLCREAMKLGATDFLGKPFICNSPFESRIREALSHQGASNGVIEITSTRIIKFKGGGLVFYENRVELCGIRVCGGKNSSIKRRVLDLLCERTGKGQYRCFPIKSIADRLNLERLGAVAEAVSDFRRICRERLRDYASIDCENEDVISNQDRGYHLCDWIKVSEGIDEANATPTDKNATLTKSKADC
jgi:CheY-like chemotaxis protein